MIRRGLQALVPIGAMAMVGYLIFTHGASMVVAFAAVPPWVLAAAVSAHVLTLALRTEAWRTVLRAAGGHQPEPVAVHAANAGAFLAGTLQGQAALPTRVALLRRFSRGEAPAVSKIALGDAPIVMFEVCASAVLAAIGSTAVGAIPGWAPWAMLGGAVAILAALGTTSMVTATVAGMVVSAATIVAVLIYAGAVWAWRTAAGAAPSPAPEPL